MNRQQHVLQFILVKFIYQISDITSIISFLNIKTENDTNYKMSRYICQTVKPHLSIISYDA